MNQLLLTQDFQGVSVDFYRNQDEFLFTMEQVSQLAGYSDVSKFQRLLQNHPELRERRASFLMKSEALEGGVLKNRERRFFTEEGLWEVLMVSGTPKGIEFRRFIAGVLKKLRKGELITDGMKSLPQKVENSLVNLETMAEKLLESHDNAVLPSLAEIIKGMKEFESRLQVIEKEMKEQTLAVSVTQKAMEDMMGEMDNIYEKLGN